MNHTRSQNQVPYYVKPKEGKLYWKTENLKPINFEYSTYSLHSEVLSLYKHHKDEKGYSWSSCIAVIPLANIAMFVPNLE